LNGPPDDRIRDLRSLFFESASELVQRMNEEALSLEKSPGDLENSRSLRRTVHTLKGDAAACDFPELRDLAHQFEDVLALENPAAKAAIPEVALRAADIFAAMLQAYQGNTPLPDLQALRSEFARIAHGEPAVSERAAPKKPKSSSDHPATPWSEYEHLAIGRALEEGQRVYHVVVKIDPQCGMPLAARQMLQIKLAGMGEILALYPGEKSAEVPTRIEAALASAKSPAQIRSSCLIPTVSSQIKIKTLRPSAAATSSDTAPEAQAEPAQAVRSAAHPAVQRNAAVDPEGTSPAHTAASESILRVEAERIDNVLDLVGELILAKSMLQQALIEFSRRFPKDPLAGRFNDAMAFQARVLNDLQRSVMKVRMVPVDQIFRRFPRTVRDTAQSCGKDVNLVIRGGDTDLDKSILDAIVEPLTHLLRNAVGHGIETAAERVRAGKPAQGTLELSAYHQGNQVVIEVSDDGGGINVEKVRARAIAQNIVKPDDAARMTRDEILYLILRAGCTTADEITELSGRGVGLDVVHTVLSRLKGSVQIESNPGHGTTFRLRLPLTLAIIRALLFRVEDRIYALPLNSVAEITRTAEEAIHEVQHSEALQLRNDVLPLLRLSPRPPGSDSAQRKVFVLVMQRGDQKFGLIVDQLVGEDELVIKALDDQSITTDLVSGAAILGDGRVVLILNINALVDHFLNRRLAGASADQGLLSTLGSLPQTHTPETRGAAGGQP
jgi:two-component system, chemotaxis family, sensor kinase CheA